MKKQFYTRIFAAVLAVTMLTSELSAYASSTVEEQTIVESADFSNLLIYVSFTDSKESVYNTETIKYFDEMRQYFAEEIEEPLKIENICPQYDTESEEIAPIVLENTEEYYVENESELLKEIAEKINENNLISEDMNLHCGNEENILDNLTIILPSNEENENCFQSHQANLEAEIKIEEYIVESYIILLESDLGEESAVVVDMMTKVLGYSETVDEDSTEISAEEDVESQSEEILIESAEQTNEILTETEEVLSEEESENIETKSEVQEELSLEIQEDTEITEVQAFESSAEESETESETYYFDSNYRLSSGWKTVDGVRYYFNEKGILQTGFFQVGNYHYYAEEAVEEGEMQLTPVGAVAKGVKTVNGKVYGFHSSKYYMLTGWQTISGERYYFKNDCTAVIGWYTTGGNTYYADEEGHIKKGVTSILCEDGENRNYYFDKNYKLSTGWIKIDGKYRYFTNGETPEECYEVEYTEGEGYWKILNDENQSRCYVHTKNGVYKGFKTIDGKKYYFDAQGFLKSGWFEVNGTWYYAENSLAKGVTEIDGKHYYFDKNNKLSTGWIKVDGIYRYFKNAETPEECYEVEYSEGEGCWKILNDEKQSRCYIHAKNGVYKGLKTIDGQKYYFDNQGILQIGWIEVNGVWYYAEESATEETREILFGALAKGLKTIEEKIYYFDKNNKLQTGWIKIDGEYKFFDEGNIAEECFEVDVTEIDGNWYILADGRKGYITSKNVIYKGFKTIGNKKYYFDDQGIYVYELDIIAGWRTMENGQTGYMDKKGNIYTGFKTIDGYRYYFNSQGYLQSGWFTVSGKNYYGEVAVSEGEEQEIPVGALAAGIRELNGETYCFNTKNYYMLTGWQTVSGQRFYINSDGTAETDWFTVKNKDYYAIKETYFDEITGKNIYRGNVLKGAQEIDGETYVFHKTNYYQLTGLQTADGKKYYLDESGKAMTGWFTVGTARYYGELETADGILKGTLACGVKEIDGTRYFFHATKCYRATGWQSLNGSKYYMDAEGRVLTGWQKILWKEYFFNEDGIYMTLSAPTLSSVKSSIYKTAAVKWKAVTGASGYILEYSKSSKFPENETETEIIEDGMVTEFSVENLDTDEKYYFRVKYFAAAGDETAYSKYSKTLNVTTHGEVKATSTSAVISECSIVSGSRNTGIKVQLKAALSERIKSSDDFYYIVETESYGTALDVEEPIAVLEKDFQIDTEFTISEGTTDQEIRSRVDQTLMNKFALAIKKSDGTYQVISTPMGITNPEYISENTAEIFKASSKKGIQGVTYADDGTLVGDARYANTKQTLFNINLEDRVANGEQSGYVEYQYKGKCYYFSDFSDLLYDVQSLNDGYKQYVYGNKGTTKVSVTFCLLLGYDSSKTYLIDPAARSKGHKYYTLNVREEKARETYEALFCYMGEVFGQDDCYVTNWVLGNEVNSSKAWNYQGSLSKDTYVKCYTAAFRLLYNGVKASKTGNNVFISLDNGWNAAPDTYSGKSILDKFAEYAQKENPDMLWSIAYHGYSYPLTRCDFWNDNTYTTNSTSTKYISMKNISVLTKYVASLEEKYDKPEGSMRVILSEQGYNAGKGAEIQAKALARGYYIAEFNDRIDAFIIRAIIDDADETAGGLYLGLHNRYQDKRISFYVYEYMDTDLDKLADTDASAISTWNQNKVESAKNILCNTEWERIISGFSREKLAKMD